MHRNWRSLAKLHQERLVQVVSPGCIDRDVSKGLDPANPIFNFLKLYYRIKGPKELRRLMRWSPGFGAQVHGVDPRGDKDLIQLKWTQTEGDRVLFKVPEKGLKSLQQWEMVLRRTMENKPVLNCFGMHEWAMVYASSESSKFQSEVMDFRVSQREINELVVSKGVNCTHFDAYRFFSPDAFDFSKHGHLMKTCDRATGQQLENPACIHTAMDTFKVAYKFYPLINSELLLESLELSIDARRIDVRASPYDPSKFGLEPIKVETVDGRREYQIAQRNLLDRSQRLRGKLLKALDEIYESCGIINDDAYPQAKCAC
mmetsp:Transcript_17449/g.28174  ORF Transcript_17449/g.28174 Transcript_17449/m.28174 type:complete len:315 (+) Transcript_17449:174-1118(+)|eukprot:CAMPEP_0203785906 /NCGR_PEP_ID=MMETSP0100_2-20121128/1298_1 /ASSEMBLY_ACC=CAM_ASM_000210 /TAXON_ID=96639 /ORGANISM=" , Strain NY0313808BC1" /LENGTH=314 /DNA_ID=CAMNT_0050688083 /DNA_START=67 /DNA_END=1011 /DNA_ORIENTATION=-